MTAEAGPIEDRLDIAIKIDLKTGRRRELGQVDWGIGSVEIGGGDEGGQAE